MAIGSAAAATPVRALRLAGVAADCRDLTDIGDHLLPALAHEIGADWAIYHQAGVGALTAGYTQLDVAWPDPAALAVAMIDFGSVAAQLPTLQRIATHPGPGVVVLSELITRRRWHDTEVYRRCLGRIDLDDQLACVVDVVDGTARGITLNRRGRAFTRTDAVLLEMAAPHLAAAIRRAHASGSPYAAVEITPTPRLRWVLPPPGPAGPRLTRREHEVLALVATGLTSRRIATRLGVSIRTVDKHLENAYRALGVDNRMAAIARVQGLPTATSPVYGVATGASGRLRSADRAQPT